MMRQQMQLNFGQEQQSYRQHLEQEESKARQAVARTCAVESEVVSLTAARNAAQQEVPQAQQVLLGLQKGVDNLLGRRC